jgi:ketosteroid isomerase-like protein
VPAPSSPTDLHSAAGTPAEDANAAVIAGIAGPLDKFATALSAILPDTATYDLAGSPTVMTGKQYKAVVASIQKRYSDASVAEPSVWAFDDYVVAEWVFSGTNKAKKKAVTTHGAIVIQMAGGKIASAWDYDDRLELEAQLAPPKQP